MRPDLYTSQLLPPQRAETSPSRSRSLPPSPLLVQTPRLRDYPVLLLACPREVPLAASTAVVQPVLIVHTCPLYTTSLC